MSQGAEFDEAGAHGTMSNVEQTLLSLDAATQSRLLTLLRGVPHSGTARSEFNGLAWRLGVDANDILAHFRDSGLPPRVQASRTDDVVPVAPLSQGLRWFQAELRVDEETGALIGLDEQFRECEYDLPVEDIDAASVIAVRPGTGRPWTLVAAPGRSERTESTDGPVLVIEQLARPASPPGMVFGQRRTFGSARVPRSEAWEVARPRISPLRSAARHGRALDTTGSAMTTSGCCPSTGGRAGST